MIRWVVFAVVAAGWIATCYIGGSLVGGTAAGVPAAQAMDGCAQRLVEAGRVGNLMAGRADPECARAHLTALRELAAPYVRKGLLWGVLPVVFVGGLMVMRSRRT